MRRKGRSAAFQLCLWLAMTVPAVGAVVCPGVDQVQDLLRSRIEKGGSCPVITVGGEICHSSPALPSFYEERRYQPAWFGDAGILPQAEALIRALRQASQEGLNPRDYHLELIEYLMEQVRGEGEKPADSSLKADLDFLLSDAFLVYASHLTRGRVDPLTVESTWFSERRQYDMVPVLRSAISENRIEDSLLHLHPTEPAYRALRAALPRYRRLLAEGGWPAVPGGPSLKKGMTGERVLALRTRLSMEVAESLNNTSVPSFFDEELELATKEIQRRYGLDADGVAGRNTLAALNMPTEARVEQIIANMERWRWLPHALEDRYILVNIADQKLVMVEDGKNRIEMRVVVGMPYWSTPVFSSSMKYLVFNPYWNVPPRIARAETLPRTRKDPSYLERNHLRLLSGWRENQEIIDPSTIDWASVRASSFPYRFRQEPGPENSLGRVKFMFPNRFDVYLHDTPVRELFAKPGRTFSHGCIRLEKPLELAEYLLQDPVEWSMENILKLIDSGTQRIVRLPNAVPIHVLYWTAWADDSGAVHFRNDIYGRDEALMKAMREQPPTA